MKQAKSILIVEDEPIIADDIALSLEELGYTVAEILDSGEKVLAFLKDSSPDLILLDINIKGSLDGIQLAHEINAHFNIPFVYLSSLFDATTIKRAKNTNPSGYIVKPFKESDLQVHIELALSKKAIVDELKPNSESLNHLFVRKEGAIIPLDFEQVDYIAADDNYAVFHIKEEKHIVSNTLKEVEEKLTGHGFCRIHKTYLVNLRKIDRIEHSVVFVNDQMLPIGKVYRKSFMGRLTIF
ncbi:MAG: response regulator [Marinoscillum sp.]